MYVLGDITISGGMIFTVGSDLNGASLQFTLTCISTGGPATTVTWTRDSVTVTEGIKTETLLDNRTTSQYTHTLTVTGRLGGLYTCTVANNKPSEDSAQLTVQGITSIDLSHLPTVPGTNSQNYFCSIIVLAFVKKLGSKPITNCTRGDH